METYPFKIVNDADRGIRGSSIHYESRENATSKVRGEGGQCLCTLMEANERSVTHTSLYQFSYIYRSWNNYNC